MTEIVDQPDLVRGDSRTIKVTVLDAVGDPVDITGDLITFTLKADVTVVDPGVLQVKVTAPAGADSTAGTAYLKLVAADTDALTVETKYWYDVQWVRKATSPEEVYTLVKGRMKVIADVTRSTNA